MKGTFWQAFGVVEGVPSTIPYDGEGVKKADFHICPNKLQDEEMTPNKRSQCNQMKKYFWIKWVCLSIAIYELGLSDNTFFSVWRKTTGMTQILTLVVLSTYT